MDVTCSTLSILLSQTGGRLQVPLSQACELVGLSSKTWRNRASEGHPPFPTTLPPRRVDLRDLAAFIDTRRPVAFAAAPSEPLPEAKAGETTCMVEKRGRGRPSNASKLAAAQQATQQSGVAA